MAVQRLIIVIEKMKINTKISKTFLDQVKFMKSLEILFMFTQRNKFSAKVNKGNRDL